LSELHQNGLLAGFSNQLLGMLGSLLVFQVSNGNIGSSRAKAIAVACPIPESEPGTIATSPWSFFSIVLSHPKAESTP